MPVFWKFCGLLGSVSFDSMATREERSLGWRWWKVVTGNELEGILFRFER